MYYNDSYNNQQSHALSTVPFFFEISCVISNWYATRSSNNTTIYMDLGESSTFFRIRCLEFYFPRHSVASLFLSIFPFLSFPLSLFCYFLSLPHSHYISFSFSSLGSHPLASMPRIALLGISEVLSRIQGLASSLMDGSAILFHSTPPPLRALTIHLSVVAPLRHSVPIRPLDGRLCRV